MAETTMLAATTADAADAADDGGDGLPKRRGLGIGFWMCVGWLGLVTLLCILAPWLPFVDKPGSPGFLNPSRSGPSAEHWFGTNRNGDDIFSQVIWGGRVSLMVGVGVVVIGMASGGVIGMAAGYFRGMFDRVVSAAVDVMLAFPGIILALAAISVFSSQPDNTVRPSLPIVIGSLSILSVAPLARITRGITLTIAEREFVTAARTLGAKHSRILSREILPNVIPVMAVFSLTVVAVVLVAEGALAFLGLSVTAPAPTWGRLILAGQETDVLRNSAHVVLFPAGVLSMTVLALNYVGDVLQGKFAVREGAL